MNLLTLSTRSDFFFFKSKQDKVLLHYDPKCPVKVNNMGHSEKKKNKNTETGLKRKKAITLEVIEAKEGIISYILFH